MVPTKKGRFGEIRREGASAAFSSDKKKFSPSMLAGKKKRNCQGEDLKISFARCFFRFFLKTNPQLKPPNSFQPLEEPLE